MALHLGKRPARYDRRDLLYADVRPKGLTLPNVPGTWGHGMDFPDWGMLGNDTCGDCAWAGPAHEEMQAAHEANRPIPPFSTQTIVEQYSEYSGYDPTSGTNDNGSDIREVLKWRQTRGLLDDQGAAHQIGAYVALEPGNWQALREASYLFQAVGIGIQFPDSAMDQFNAGQTWTVVPGAQVNGGHYVPVVGHAWPGYWTVITWGKRQVATWPFLAKYMDEAYAYIDSARYKTVTGLTYNGYADIDLERYLAAVGSQKGTP